MFLGRNRYTYWYYNTETAREKQKIEKANPSAPDKITSSFPSSYCSTCLKITLKKVWNEKYKKQHISPFQNMLNGYSLSLSRHGKNFFLEGNNNIHITFISYLMISHIKMPYGCTQSSIRHFYHLNLKNHTIFAFLAISSGIWIPNISASFLLITIVYSF